MKTNTLKIVIIFGILIIGAALGFFFFLMEIRSQVMAISNAEQQQTEQATYEKQNDSLKNLLDSISSSTDKLSSRILTTDSAVTFIENLENEAKKQNLTILVNSITNTSASQGAPYQLIEISMSTQGSWQSSYNYLSVLEHTPFVTYLKNASFNNASIVGASGSKAQSQWKGDYILDVLEKP